MTIDNKYYWEPQEICLNCGNDETDHCSACEVCETDLIEEGSFWICTPCRERADE